MKICPKCRGLYFDQDEQCANCKIELIDKDVFNTALGEYYKMNHSQRVANRFDSRYEIVCKYQFPEIYEFNQQESDRYYAELQRNARQRQLEQQRIEKQQNIPKCPTCGSTNIEKISDVKKVAGFLTVGVFSKNFGKTYHCKNCDYRW